MAEFLKKEQCPRCVSRGADRSKDNLARYSDGSCYCFACSYTELSDEEKEKRGIEEFDYDLEEVMTREAITKEENEKIKSYTGTDGKGFRGIREEINKYFGVRYQYSEETGEPIKEFVPITQAGELVGYKTRIFPKDFSQPIGKVGKDCDLVGQFRFKNFNHTLLIVGGEIKQRAAYQMLSDDQKARGKDNYDPVAVVSPTVGESGAAKQIALHYEWLCQFSKIIVCMDMDEAGQKANEAICKVLPKGKAYVMQMRYKDADEYIKNGKEREFISDFWKARQYVPHGVTSSTDLSDAMDEFLSIPRVSLPPYLHKLQKMLRGGLPSCIFNVLSASGTGKSTHCDAMTIHWIMNAGKKVGVVPMEASAGEYGVNLLSSYMKRKINLFETEQERLDFVKTPEAVAAKQELFYDETGAPRFYILDAEAETIKSKIEYLIISLDCSIIIIDPLQDVFDLLGEDEQAAFMAWQKSWMKKGVLFVNINHARKNSQGAKANSKGADLSEEDMHGHSSIFKSGGVNLILMRNKEAETELERNTTIMKLTKARGIGETGIVGKYYYDLETHQVHDIDDWVNKQEVSF